MFMATNDMLTADRKTDIVYRTCNARCSESVGHDNKKVLVLTRERLID